MNINPYERQLTFGWVSTAFCCFGCSLGERGALRIQRRDPSSRSVATGPAGETGRQTRPQLSNLCQDIDGQDHCARGGSVSSVPRKLSANQSELPQSAQAN